MFKNSPSQASTVCDPRTSRNQRSKCQSPLDHRKKQESSRKNIYFCFIDCAKAFDCVDHNKLWKILQEMEILDHLTFLLRNLYASQEATVQTGHGTMDCFQLGKGVCQGCILSPCLFNFYASCQILGWMKHKLLSGLLGKISIISDMQMTLSL